MSMGGEAEGAGQMYAIAGGIVAALAAYVYMSSEAPKDAGTIAAQGAVGAPVLGADVEVLRGSALIGAPLAPPVVH